MASHTTWKLWLLRWMSLYPTIYLLSLAIGMLGLEPPLEVRLLVTTGAGSLLMTYVFMPFIMKRFAGWIAR